MSETTLVATYVDTETHVVSAVNGVDYAYRSTGGATDATPLVAMQHFRGNLDNWDPALIDALARGRRVITFDNRGVAASSGTTPSTIAQMALDAIDFIDALGVGAVDLLGFSIGSFLAQEIALIRPDLLRRVVLASSAPQGAAGMHGVPANGIFLRIQRDSSATDYSVWISWGGKRWFRLASGLNPGFTVARAGIAAYSATNTVDVATDAGFLRKNWAWGN